MSAAEPPGTARQFGRAPVLLLLLFIAWAIWIKWGKLDSLLWQDPAWWLNACGRFAHYQLPFRDYYWPYGPLSLDLFGWPMRLLGPSFTVAQIVIDILSAAVVFFVYRIARRLMPSPLAELTVFWLVAVGITARTFFSLFSMISYAPAIHAGGAGVLMMMDGVIAYLQDGRRRMAWISAGAMAACLSKHETLAAAVMIFILLVACDRQWSFAGRSRQWAKHYVFLGCACFLVPLIDYARLGQLSGWAKFMACIQGFGLARVVCPWWPTGYGLAGDAVAVLQAAAIFIIGLMFIPETRRSLARRHWMAAVFLVATAAVSVIYEWRLYSDLLHGHGPVGQRIYRNAIELLSTSSVLRPVLWAGYGYAALLLLRAVAHRAIGKPQFIDLLVVAVPGLMGLRNLFGSGFGPEPVVPAISYPFLLLLGPYLLYVGLLSFPEPRERSRARASHALAFCAIAMVGYGLIRLLGGYSALLSHKTFPVLTTPSGRIALKMHDEEKPILDYVLANSAPGDTLLELPYGGGMSFATGRMQPTYSTLFVQLEPPPAIQQEDLRRLMAHPPAVVIARQGPHLGTLYGFEGNVGCPCPHFVWKADKPSSDPNYVFPVIDYIERHYQVDRTIGPWVLLRPGPAR